MNIGKTVFPSFEVVSCVCMYVYYTCSERSHKWQDNSIYLFREAYLGSTIHIDSEKTRPRVPFLLQVSIKYLHTIHTSADI